MKIIRWVGGKDSHKHLPHMIPFPLTADIRYYEPFFGGGSMFFTLKPSQAVLGDINTDLMSMWGMVKLYPKEVGEVLHNLKQDEQTFYQIRERYNNFDGDLIDRAAMFIYINRTNFRGLYRVNAKGKLNTPYGHVNGTEIPDQGTIDYYSGILNHAQIRSGRYIETCHDIRPGDFAFFDPPYHDTYDSYSTSKFGEAGQLELKAYLDQLSNKGVSWLMTNSSTDLIHELYKDYHIKQMDTIQQISQTKESRQAKEVIVTNYKITLRFL